MLYKRTIKKQTLELLKKLMADNALKSFTLVGGTALALQVGHRISIDIDLFTKEPFNVQKLTDHLRINYQFESDFIEKNTIKGEINGIQLDCITHQYPWLTKPVILEDIRIADIKDIAAMKLNAITGDGTRLKNFIDIAWLSSQMTLNTMLTAYAEKYNSNKIMPLKAILYYEDINFNEPINMLSDSNFNWNKIKDRLTEMHISPDKIFKNPPI